MKAGQIAHLDRNNANNNEDNLAFLCLEHHDAFDSRASQRKGFLAVEVAHFRDELYRAIDKAFSIEVHFGQVVVPKEDPYAGAYTRISDDESSESAEIIITPVPDGLTTEPRYAVTGQAYWGLHREIGPNLGEMTFIARVDNNVIERTEQYSWKKEPHTTRLTFEGKRLIVHEENWGSVYGMNVCFVGEYERTQLIGKRKPLAACTLVHAAECEN